MNRQDLINRLVARKLQHAGKAKVVCAPPCYAKALGFSGINLKALSFPRANAKK
jgi:hypothetical protein